jgi:transcriptional regulator with XRE-family HTH domain
MTGRNDRMGCQVQTINKIENARYSPNCDILYSLLECLDLTLKINNENKKKKKRILGFKLINRSWAIVEENISDLPQFSDLQYEIKEDKYIVDSSDDEVITFKIANFEKRERQQFKMEY